MKLYGDFTKHDWLDILNMVKDWSGQGYIGVDMETATTFAVAEKFNKKAVALLNLSDTF